MAAIMQVYGTAASAALLPHESAKLRTSDAHDLFVPTSDHPRAVLGAVKAASCRLRRWPAPALTEPTRGAPPIQTVR
jgi:hypothetical protein